MFALRLLAILMSTYLSNAPLFFSEVSQSSSDLPFKRDMRVEKLTVSGALEQVANTYRVTISLEAIERASPEGPLSLDLHQASVTSALDAVVKAAPRYRWHRDEDGSIRVVSVEEPPDLGNIYLSNFSFEGVRRREVSRMLDSKAEIQSWLHSHGCKRVEYSIGHDWDSDTNRFSISANGKTLREDLDRVALAAGTYYWSIIRMGDLDGCQISIKL